MSNDAQVEELNFANDDFKRIIYALANLRKKLRDVTRRPAERCLEFNIEIRFRLSPSRWWFLMRNENIFLLQIC